MNVHFTDSYLLNPQHKVTVNLIGLGGTGSQVLSCLVCLNEALNAFGHPGLHVYAFDGDIVSEANIGRQLFSRADIGINKAIVLVSRTNRTFGFEWEAIPHHFSDQYNNANITISCVDTAAGRLEIADIISTKDVGRKMAGRIEPTVKAIYWLDFGNGKKTGQVILGTVEDVPQPLKTEHTAFKSLPTVVKKFPQLKKLKEKDQGPSCSLAAAIEKQDLYINRSLAPLGMNILWKLFREAVISSHGLYYNSETMISNPIKIQ